MSVTISAKILFGNVQVYAEFHVIELMVGNSHFHVTVVNVTVPVCGCFVRFYGITNLCALAEMVHDG